MRRTRSSNRTKRALGARSLGALAAVVGLLVPQLATGDDTDLFSTVVPPNVMLMVDNSGSMHHVVWHPAFDPAVAPTCTFFTNNKQYFVGRFSSDTNGPSSSGDSTFRDGTYSLPSPPAGCITGSRTIFEDDEVADSINWTRWNGTYLNWLYSPAADVVPAGSTLSYAEQIMLPDNGTFSSCLGGGTFSLYTRARIHAARDILREVICQVNAAGAVRFGLAQFRRGGDPNGGYVRVPAEDYRDASGAPNVYTLNGTTATHGAHLDEAIDDLTGEAWTPLAETLFQVYTYFMSRDSSDRPSGFPVYDYRACWTCENGGQAGSPTPGSPVQSACQKNFVVIITDGEPTKDDFDTNWPTSTATGFSDFKSGTLIGDYNPDGEVEEPGSFPGCSGCEATRWLDDIAKYMQENDFRPDLDPHNGQEQVIDVYTVGFTTSPFANAILQKTAQEGNGQFYFSTDPEQLASDIIGAVTDIIQKSQSFTAATVPAVRAADGGKFYTSLFVPSVQNGYWEGHLKAWTITASGTITDKLGNCALNDPSGNCLSGPFLGTAVPFWDAGEELTSRSPASRDLITSRVSGATAVPVAFDAATMTAADLGVTAGDIGSYSYLPHPEPTTAEELADALVWNVRGCELGDTGGTCKKRPWLLGDIFHSNPVVVPEPQGFFGDQTFQTFEANLAGRDRMIIAGANDGFVHFFDAGTWQATPAPGTYDDGTGDEIVAFMPYAARKNAKEIPADSNGRTFYFVDGAPTAADVWLYQTGTQVSPKDGTDWKQWRTVVIGGMRQGGNQYYALDVTDPGASSCTAPATGSGYPCYLWEFPQENAATGPGTVVSYMGQTFSEPIVTKVRVDPTGGFTQGYDRWVAIFGAGYAPESDPNEFTRYDATATAGRALIVLDIKSGKVLGMKKFDPDPSVTPDPTTDVGGLSYDPDHPEKYMHHAFASTPGVYDIDFDGYADLVVVGDLGGNLWKWDISAIGHDPINGSGSTDQPRWDFSKVFSAPSEVVGGNRYFKSIYFAPSATFKGNDLWYAFGTGERMNLTFDGFAGADENNRFYAIRDSDPLNDNGIADPLAENPDLTNITALAGGSCPDLSASSGFYIVGADGEKFITQSDIFFFNVFVASYIPTVSSDPCVSKGDSHLYAFKVYCGQGLYDTDGDGTPEQSVSLGSGMPTDPKITIGTGDDGGGGGGGGPSPNRVIVNMQDGTTVNTDGDDGGNATIGQFYWREM